MGKNTDDFFKEKKEWSKVKDDILGYYLKPYFTKIQYTKKGIVYIDGFSGKGKFDDDTLGSPLISYNIAKEVNDSLNIKFCFIENKYAKELEENVKDCKNVEVINGNYEDNVVDIINKNIGKNVFVYIDPFGIKNINFSYLKRFNSSSLNSVEFLMNLNSFGFIREGCRLLKSKLEDVIFDEEYDAFMDESQDFKNVNSIEHMNEIAGGDYWQKIIKDHQDKKITGFQAETQFIDAYCKKLKESGNFKYVINIPIRTKAGTPPKYRLVFATNHIDGVIIMNDNMCNRFDELLKLQNCGYSSLFQENSENEFITSEQIENDLTKLLTNEFIDYFDLVVKYINRYGIMKTKVLNECLKNLENKRKIIINRIPSSTPTGRVSKFILPQAQKGQKTFIKTIGDKND